MHICAAASSKQARSGKCLPGRVFSEVWNPFRAGIHFGYIYLQRDVMIRHA